MKPSLVGRHRPHAVLADLVNKLGPHARAATPPEVARDGDVVVVTIPLGSYPLVPTEELRGKGFNNICFQHLDEIGYDTVDLGSLSEGCRTQPDGRHTASCMP